MVSAGGAETVSETEMDCGLLEAPVELTVMLPKYVPVPSPTGLTEILRLAGVVPLFKVTESQVPPEVVVAEALKVRAIPLLPTDTDCIAGATPPVWKAKFRAEEPKVSAAAEPGITVTMAETDLVESAMLAAATVTLAGLGTVLGAV